MISREDMRKAYLSCTAGGERPNNAVTEGSVLNIVLHSNLYMPNRLYMLTSQGITIIDEPKEAE